MKENVSTPYLNTNNDLVIPSDCSDRYKHWAGGQSVVDTLKEINAPLPVLQKYGRLEETQPIAERVDNEGLSWMNKG